MSRSNITISQVLEVTEEIVAAFTHLVPQLSSHPVDPDGLNRVLAGPGNTLLIARDKEQAIVGTLCLATYNVPTGTKAWIEDVVVDGGARGQGIGEALVEKALAIAQELGAHAVDLTSRPSREAANRLYERAGFTLRTTNVWRFEIARQAD